MKLVVTAFVTLDGIVEAPVVVTRTVRDLATGTDLAFSPRGSASLRGVPGEWEIFEAETVER
jgi:hypothetical protein